MNSLKKMFNQMGFKNISTYIQSGNVLFEAGKHMPSELESLIKKQIRASFSHDVPVIIRTPEEMKMLRVEFPYSPEIEGWKGYITFLAESPAPSRLKELLEKSSPAEKIHPGDRVVYSHINKQANQKQLFSNAWVEKTLKVSATTRNLKTVDKLIQMSASPT